LLKVPGQPSRMLPGEAAAFLVLERHGDARQRGAPVLALCEGIRAPAGHGGAWSGAAKTGRALAERMTAAPMPGDMRCPFSSHTCSASSRCGHRRSPSASWARRPGPWPSAWP
jgi:hypothetical protein